MIVLIMYVPVIVLSLLSCAHCANILGIFMAPSISHQIVFQPIWRELSLRGHNVTVITPDPLNDPNLTNLTEINVHYTYDFFKDGKIQEMVSKDNSVFQIVENMYQIYDMIAEAELNNTQVKELIADQNRHFDLVLVEWFHPVMYAFAGRFKAPVIGVSSLGIFVTSYDTVGNPTHPALYPEMFLGYLDNNLSLWQKFKSVAFSLWLRYFHDYVLVPRSHELAKKYFGNDLPHVGDLERNQSMLFVNVNPLIYPPRPTVPAIVEMGQMHIKPLKPLPQDLKNLLDEATEGVIYFSLGSNVKSVYLDAKLKTTIIGALAELPYKILWKWESDDFPGRPSNVVTRKWLPQQDVLAHPNIRAFVTQGGLQSIEEAISRGVPMVGMPFMGDQSMNVHKIADIGIGLALDPSTVTKTELKKTIIEVAENKKYKKRIEEVRDLLNDKPMTGLESAVWWSQYVIRHKGAKHMRSPMADISWFEYLLIDVLMAVMAVLGGILYLTYKVVKLSSYSRKFKSKMH